jgi:hypothetical protein
MTWLDGLLIMLLGFLIVLSSSCILQKYDKKYQESKQYVEVEKEPERSWFWKHIDATFVGVKYDNIVVYDAEDDMEFSFRPQDMTLTQYLQLKNNFRKGDVVHIEVHSLVNLDTNEVEKRYASKIWY